MQQFMYLKRLFILLGCVLCCWVVFGNLTVLGQDEGRSPQEQEDLNQIMEAYGKKSVWQTYHSHTRVEWQAALTLENDDISTPYAFLETASLEFDGVYLPELRGVEGEYAYSQTFDEWSEVEEVENLSVYTQYSIVGLDGQIYVRGEHETRNGEDSNPILNSLETYTLFSNEIESMEQGSLVRRVADYNMFPTRENILAVLESAHQITNLGVQSVDDPLLVSPVQVYEIDVNPTEGIIAFNLDIDRILTNSDLTTPFDRDAFYDELASSAVMTLIVYLDPTTGELIREDILLSGDIRVDGILDSSEDSLLQVVFTYEKPEFYSEINAPAEVQLPTLVE